jgi:hypothetical protein
MASDAAGGRHLAEAHRIPLELISTIPLRPP